MKIYISQPMVDKTDEEILIEHVKDMLNSKAKTIVLQIQDFLLQGEAFRMNIPGKTEGCWEYRVPKNFEKIFKKTLRKLNWKIC